MALTVANVKTQVQALMDTQGTAAVNSAEWLTLIDFADDYVWRMLVGVNPDFWLTETRVTWPSDVDNIDLSSVSYLNTKPYKIVALDLLQSNAAVSTTNLPMRCGPMRWDERALYLVRDDGIYRSSITPVTAVDRPPYRFALKDSADLYVAPIPIAGTVFQVGYIPPRATLTSTSDTILGGKADAYGQAVVAYAAWTLNNRKGGSNPQIGALWSQWETQLAATGADRQVAGPKRVKWVRW
jgi:hypothetical protein